MIAVLLLLGPVGLVGDRAWAADAGSAAPPLSRERPAGDEGGLPIGDRLHVLVPQPPPRLLLTGVELLRRRVAARTRGAVAVEIGEGVPQLRVAVTDPGPVPSPFWEADQGYTLVCGESGVQLDAPNALGELYGLVALSDLVAETEAGRWALPAGRLADAPDLPLRGAHRVGLWRDPVERRAWRQRLAELRVNALVIADDAWWRLDDAAERGAAQAAFADLRDYGIEPIPELPSLGWAHGVLALDPMCAEGSWVRREQLTLFGRRPTALARVNVLRTETTDIVVEDAEGGRYAPGRDYEVLDGETRHPYRPEAAPFRLRRLADSRIPDGATVHVSYDYVSAANAYDVPYCPSEPRVAAIMDAAVGNVIQHLRPAAIHLGHNEPAPMGSDSRCLAREPRRPAAELLTEDIRRLHRTARVADPHVRVMLWADAVDPYRSRRTSLPEPLTAALPGLPKDLILGAWFYGADSPDHEGAASLRYFGAHGFATTGSPWRDPQGAEGWVRECRAARLRGEECLGVICTSWGEDWGALEAAATAAWRVPRSAASP